MGFDTLAQDPKAMEVIGSFLPAQTGVVVLDSGSATVTLPRFQRVDTAFASSQTANAARVSATSGATFTITGTGTDIVMWLAFGVAKV